MTTIQGQTLTERQKGLAACAFPVGEPNVNYAQYFIGDSFVAPIKAANLSENEATVMSIVNVTFEPGCRNNWHIHHGAHQMLICVSGKGWYQEWGKAYIHSAGKSTTSPWGRLRLRRQSSYSADERYRHPGIDGPCGP